MTSVSRRDDIKAFLKCWRRSMMSPPPSQSPPTRDHELRAASRNCGRNASGGCSSAGYHRNLQLCLFAFVENVTARPHSWGVHQQHRCHGDMWCTFMIIMTGTTNVRMYFAVQTMTGWQTSHCTKRSTDFLRTSDQFSPLRPSRPRVHPVNKSSTPCLS